MNWGLILGSVRNLRPHPEEAPTGPREARPDGAVSKDGHNTGACAILRDASLRDAPQDEVGDSRRLLRKLLRMRSEIHSLPLSRSGACRARVRRYRTIRDWSRSAPPDRGGFRGT